MRIRPSGRYRATLPRESAGIKMNVRRAQVSVEYGVARLLLPCVDAVSIHCIVLPYEGTKR